MTSTVTEGLLDEYRTETDALLGRGPVFWDDTLDAWLVTGHDECCEVLRNDEVFTKADRFVEGGTDFWRGRDLPVLAGEDHRRLHSSRMRQTGPAFPKRIGPTLIRPIAERLIDEALQGGRAELGHELIDLFTVTTGCTYMGFPATRDFVTRTLELDATREIWKQNLFGRHDGGPDSDSARRGMAAVDELERMFLPTIRARRDDPQEDLISHIWAYGPNVFPDWGESDMLAACWSNFNQGETKLFIRNLVYLLLILPEQRRLLQDGSVTIEDFIEESLRFLGPIWRGAKTVMADASLAGVEVKKGQVVELMFGAIGRDPSQWPDPHRFTPGRDNIKALVTFGQGERYCVGRYLARREAREFVAALLPHLDAWEIDPEQPLPRWSGVFSRFVDPLPIRRKG